MCHPFHQIIDAAACGERPSALRSEGDLKLIAVRSRRGWLSAAAAAVVTAYAAARGRRVTAQDQPSNLQRADSALRPYGGSRSDRSTQPSAGDTMTTQALGEEGGQTPPGNNQPTTLALGEEGGGYNPPYGGPVTTQALGEEGGQTPPGNNQPTTLALGEEGGGYTPPYRGPVTTQALGEEGGSYYPPYQSYRPYIRRYWRPDWRRLSR